MTRPVRLLLFILLWIIVLGGGFVVFWVRDANVLKPALERIIEARTGTPVSIEGALQWQWRPSVAVTATQLNAAHRGHDWTIARIRLQLDAGALLRGPGRWRADGFELSGPVTFVPHATDELAPDTSAAGQCAVELTSTQQAQNPGPASADDLMAAALFENFDWQADCVIDSLRYRGQHFNQVQVSLSNADAADTRPFHSADFSGGTGEIDIAAIKPQLQAMARLLNDEDRLATWPDIWHYQRLNGRWEIDGQRHDLAFTLDNLAVAARGTYAPDRQQLDIMAELTFFDDPELPGFDVNPALHGLPIPIRCRGTIDEPACQLDSKRAQRLALQVLRSDDSGELRRSLDEKIDKDVPEQFRDAARALLDLLGGARQHAPHGG